MVIYLLTLIWHVFFAEIQFLKLCGLHFLNIVIFESGAAKIVQFFPFKILSDFNLIYACNLPLKFQDKWIHVRKVMSNFHFLSFFQNSHSFRQASGYHSDNWHSCWHWMQLLSRWSWHQVPSCKNIIDWPQIKPHVCILSSTPD